MPNQDECQHLRQNSDSYQQSYIQQNLTLINKCDNEKFISKI